MDQITSQSTPEGDESPQTTQKASGKKFWLDTLQTIVLALLLFFAINTVSSRVRVENVSMKPTLEPGYLLVINKLAYRSNLPRHGDIIVFHYQGNRDDDYIKRVIGLPGDTVEVADGIVSVNGTPLTEPYIAAMPTYADSWTVPPESIFVLGDNRNNSSDSHQWGFVPLEYLVGKAIFIYFPFDQIRSLSVPDLVSAASD